MYAPKKILFYRRPEPVITPSKCVATFTQCAPPTAKSWEYPVTSPYGHDISARPVGSGRVHLKHGDKPVEKVVRKEVGVPTLDLHSMTVREAIQATDEFLMRYSDHYHKVKIITGRGMHAADKEPRIKPAIIDMLKNSQYKFQEVDKGGSLEVYCLL